MSEPIKDRSHRAQLASAFLLFLGGLSLTYCLVTLEPTSAKQRDSHLGMKLAQELSSTIGLLSYGLMTLWFLFIPLLLLKKNTKRRALRWLGCVLLMPAALLVMEWHCDWFCRAIPDAIALTGPGGSCGAFLARWLDQHFSGIAQLWMVSALSVVGTLLAFDRVLILVLKITIRVLLWIVRELWMSMMTSWTPEDAEPASEEEETEPKKLTIEAAPVEKQEEVEIEEQEDYIEEKPVERSTQFIPIRHHGANGIPENKRKRWGLTSLWGGKTELRQTGSVLRYELPSWDLLEDPRKTPKSDQDEVLRERAALLEKTYADFGLNVRVVGINTGPVITQFELALEKGLRVYKVTRLAEDVALNMSVPHVRMVAPIPGKNTVGVEVPNEQRDTVHLKEVMLAAGKGMKKHKLPLFLGKDTEGTPVIQDLADMPHLLIAGRTGTGKSVCMNTIILSMLMTRTPDEVKMIMIDPKMLEMSEYGTIPHLMHPVVKDMKKAEAILGWAVDKMEERYDLLSRARVRSIAEYNTLDYEEILDRVKPEDEIEEQSIPEKMPFIVIFVDEMADLIMTMKKEVEGHIIRLAQKSRAAGIHLVVATQKPTVDVITGLIKSNLPARICFKVVNKSDSRVVLDEMGADKLLGKGDMLFLPPNGSDLLRAQGTYASNEEIAKIVDAISDTEQCYAEELLHLSASGTGNGDLFSANRDDDLYETAIEVVIREQRGSVSLLQRSLGIGYGRAARLIDFMADDGIVGPYNGSNAREVLHSMESWEQRKCEA